MSGYGRWVNIVGEPDAGNPPVRFDGGMLESWSCHAPASYPTWHHSRGHQG
jgi:hypothetical protein